jgi:D-glucosaminate-6-phosphate ammonia-lyase
MGVLGHLGLRGVINAVGPATRLGGSVLDAGVVAAMAEAASCYLPLDLLQRRAGAVIARVTGAQDGYVVSGASAGLALATAACLAGLDIAAMERLPRTDGRPGRMLMPRGHRNGYDRAVRAAGAEVLEIEPAALRGERWAREAAGAAGFVFNASAPPGEAALPDVVRAARQAGMPVIVDAAAAVPPVANLRSFVTDGADLVAFSGGKAIGGPSASGFVAGRADLILSIALQHQDMDVRAPTWGYRDAIARGLIPRPPGQGIGRSMKVGKEEIAGLVVALERYASRDHDADLRDWERRVSAVVQALADCSGVTARRVMDETTGPVPHALIELFPGVAGRTADELLIALAAGDPPVYLGEHDAGHHRLTFCPSTVTDAETQIVAGRLAGLLGHSVPGR